MPAHRLLTLGTLAVVTEGGVPVEFPAGKPLGLLIRLALSPEPATRRELVHLLWPRSSMERGLQSVRQALWLIRKTLGEDVVEGDGAVRLRPGALTCDAADLERALSEERVADADALWKGPFLHRFAVADAPEWDRWVEDHGESLARRLAAALQGAAARRRDAGDLAGARHWLERAAEIAPFEVRYREELVSFLVELRDLRGAEEALAEARQMLPEPEQRAALEGLARRVEQLRTERAVAPDERLARPDLVGRSMELADLMAVWRRAAKGGKRMVLITGPAGIGKTRLADELARTVQHEGAAAVTVRAAEVERAMEHAVIASLARALLQMPGAAGISTSSDSLLRGLAPSLPVRGGAPAAGNGETANPVALADALADLVGAVAYERPLLITVDDAGWADATSLSVLARAIRTLREGAVMVVLTARTPGGVGGVLRPLESIGGDVAYTTMRLHPLTRSETQELVALLVDLPESTGAARLLDRIHATTGGNPFYVIELIRAFLDERLIAVEGGGLRVDLSRLEGEAPWPKSVRALVRRRFERLTAEARALGHLLATVTPREPETAARQLAGLGRRAYARAVGELVEHGIVAWDGSALGFTHAELREAAAEWVEDDVPVPVWRRPWSRAQRLAGIGVVGVVAIFALLRAGWSRRTAGPVEPPYGGGDIVVASLDSVFVFRGVRIGDSLRFERVQPAFPVPDKDRLRVFRTAAGENVWLRETRDPGRGPDLMGVNPSSGEETPVVSGPGDDNINDISPDGAWIVFGSDDTVGPYDQGVHIARIDGTESRQVFEGRTASDWSPDGRHILGNAPGPVDTTLVFTPAGRVVARREGRRAGGIFCGGSERVLLREWWETGNRLVLWDWRTGAERVVRDGITEIWGCSPDGAAALLGIIRDDRELFGILDLAAGAFHRLDVELAGLLRLRHTWLPDRLAPVAASLALAPDSVKVAWGDTVSLRGTVTLSDGGRVAGELVWVSGDSSLATVSSEGVLTGNRPGSAEVHGCVDDWICDTVRVVVDTVASAELMFADTFATSLDPARWIPFGQPKPYITTASGGERVLFLNGDGIWNDGILSRDTFSLQQGVTLETEFRFHPRLDRTDRQVVALCLTRTMMPEGTEPPDEARDPEVRKAICFSYPADNLRRFDPEWAVLIGWPSYVPAYVHAPEAFPPLAWTHVAIQTFPDGRAVLYLNRRQRAWLPVRLDGVALGDWRIELTGHSVETRLEVRFVMLWRGRRY